MVQFFSNVKTICTIKDVKKKTSIDKTMQTTLTTIFNIIE